MKRNTLTVIIVAFLLIGGLVFLFTKKPIEQTGTTTTSTTTTTTTTVVVKELKYATSTSEVIIEYPEFSNMSELNTKIEKEAKALFATSTVELNSSLQGLIDLGVDISGRSLVFEQKIDRSRIYINDETHIASIVYKSYIDMGGAHGSFFYRSSVYDLQTGNELTLDNLLQNYKPTLRTYTQAQIIKATTTSTACVNCEALNGRIDSGAELISPMFYVHKDGLTFLYGAYDLGAYAITSAGQEISIPKNILSSMIKRDW